MRALLILVIVVGSVPLILAIPFIGVLVFSWISYMNPHRLAWWSFVYDMPIAMIVGSVTILAYLISREPKRIPINRVTVTWLAFIFWMMLSTLFALNPEDAVWEWERTVKIQVMALLALAMLSNRQRIDLLVWVIVVSIGFYGVKGGVFTLRTGGEYLLWGPKDSFIEGNNEIAFAILVTLPLIRYLQLVAQKKWLRFALGLSIGLCVVASLGSWSRGAFITAIAIAAFMAWKSPYRIKLGGGLLIVAALGISFMPVNWHERMETIQNYQEDASAMGRINAWQFAFNLAKDRPFVGGGFQTFTPELFRQYAPDPLDFHDSHSIYFETMAEHGFVGFGLFMLLAWFTWRNGVWIARHTRDSPELAWARHLGLMLQVSLVGYAVGGAFLGLAYFDLLYHLIALLVATRVLVEQHVRDGAVTEPETVWEALRPTGREPYKSRHSTPELQRRDVGDTEHQGRQPGFQSRK